MYVRKMRLQLVSKKLIEKSINIHLFFATVDYIGRACVSVCGWLLWLFIVVVVVGGPCQKKTTMETGRKFFKARVIVQEK